MATVGLRMMRIWMIILTFINLVIVTSHYAEQKYWDNWRNYYVYNVTGTNGYIIVKREKFLLWQDWTLIVSSSVLFLAYIYAYKVITTRLHKYLRALLMVVPTVLVLFVGIQYVHLVLKLEFPMNQGPPTPFACSYLSGLERAYCGVVEATYFFAIPTGLFALLEIYLTIRNGPMRPKENHSYGSNGGYGADATGEMVGPPEHSMVHIQNPYANTHHQKLLSPLQFSPFAISYQPTLLSSLEQGKATLDTPEQQEDTLIILSTDPSTTPVQPSPLLQQQCPPEHIYDTRAPLPNPNSVQAQPYEKYIPRTTYRPQAQPPMPEQIYDNRMPLANSHSPQPMPVHQNIRYQTKPLPLYPRQHLPEQAFDTRVPLPNPHSIQASEEPPQAGIRQQYDQRMPLPNPTLVLASAGPPKLYLPARMQIEQEYPYYGMPLPYPTPEQSAAGPPAPYPPARIQQEFDMRPPANTSIPATAPYPSIWSRQDEYDQRPPANTSIPATAPYPSIWSQQDEYDQRPPANTSIPATAPYPSIWSQQDEYDQRPPANTSIPATVPYPPTST